MPSYLKDSLILLLKKDVVVTEVIEKINRLKPLTLDQKTSILTEVNAEGFDAVILSALHAPKVLPVLQELIETLPDTPKAIIFERVRLYCYNVLFGALNEAPQAELITIVPVLELIKILPDALQWGFFKRDKDLIPLLDCIDICVPQAIPAALELIKTFPLAKQEKILKENGSFIREAMPAVLELIKTFPVAKQRELFKKTFFFIEKRVVYDGVAGLLYGTKYGLIPLGTVEFIKIFPVAEQIEIFKQVNNSGKNLLLCFAQYRSGEFSSALALIKTYPIAIQEEIIKQVDTDKVNVLLYVAQYIPQSLPMLLTLIKKFPEAARERIIHQKNNKGEGLEFYMVAGGDVKVLNIVCAMGFFNKKIKNNRGDGLLEKAAIDGKCAMLRVLISDYGLKPDINITSPSRLSEFAKYGMHPEAIDLCSNSSELNNLYAAYLNNLYSFVWLEANDVEFLPKDLRSLISSYLSYNGHDPLKDAADHILLEESVDRAFALRAELLRPFSDYCEQAVSDKEAKRILEELMASKKLAPSVLEKELDEQLKKEGFSEKSYVHFLIRCRLNTERITNNKLYLQGRPEEIQRTIEVDLKKQHESSAFFFKVLCACVAISVINYIVHIFLLSLFCSVTFSLVDVITPMLLALLPIMDYLNLTDKDPKSELKKYFASYSFQLQTLGSCMALGVLTFILGLLACTTYPISIAVTTVNTLALVGNIYGFYAHKQNVDIQDNRHVLATIPTSVLA